MAAGSWSDLEIEVETLYIVHGTMLKRDSNHLCAWMICKMETFNCLQNRTETIGDVEK